MKVVMMYLFSGGVYAIYWLYTTGLSVYELHPKRRYIPMALIFSVVILVSSVFIFAFVAVDKIDYPVWVFYLFALICLVVIYGLAWMIVSDIAKAINGWIGIKCSMRIMKIFLFVGLVCVIYLQFCINRMKANHETSEG